jgi:hypothetical protein
MGLWLTDIAIVEGGSAQEAQGKCPTGYTLVPVDLNQNAGGRCIYLCYSKGSDNVDNGENIIAITLCFNKHPWHHGQTVEVDLNKGAGGDYIYLIYVKKKLTTNATIITRKPWNKWYKLGQPISELKVLTTRHGATAPETPAGWTRVEGYQQPPDTKAARALIDIDPDLNRGTGRGDRIYLYYRRGNKPLMKPRNS